MSDVSREGRWGVVFDVDGVLVDSYEAHFQSWRALADETGCHCMSEDEFRATFGRTSRETIQQLWPGEPLADEKIAELDDRKEALFRDRLRADFRELPGAAELIVALKKAGVPIAAGSSGPPDNVALVLQRMHGDLFDAVVTGVDVSRGKPDPEVFMRCAERLQLSPSRCAVIEDAVVGVEAANRAGCLSVALVVPPRDLRPFAHAAKCVTDLRQLTPEILVQWLAEHA